MKHKKKSSFFITCEHAQPDVPPFVRKYNWFDVKLFSSHRSFDLYALELAKELRRELSGVLHHFDLSRLVIDANRTFKAQKVPSFIYNKLNVREQRLVVNRYNVYRNKIDASLEKMVNTSKMTVVLSVHTFTPHFKGKLRSTEIGLLFRSNIEKERRFAKLVQKQLIKKYRVHMNRPYRGYTDCLLNDVSDQRLNDPNVVGLFLEIKDSLLCKPRERIRMADVLSHAIRHAACSYIDCVVERKQE